MKELNRCKKYYTFDNVDELLKKVNMGRLIEERFAEYPYDIYWAEPIEDDFQNIMRYFGFTEVELCWDVSYSQGSGASFTGVWCAGDMNYEGLTSYAPEDKDLHTYFTYLKDLVDEDVYEAVITRCKNTNYCHEYTMCVNVMDEEGDFLETAEGDFLDICVQLAIWFRDRLRAAYEYEISEEGIAEMIIANEIEIEEEYIKQ